MNLFSGKVRWMVDSIGHLVGMKSARSLCGTLYDRVSSLFKNVVPVFYDRPVASFVAGAVCVLGARRFRAHPLAPQVQRTAMVAIQTFAVYTTVHHFCSLFYPEPSWLDPNVVHSPEEALRVEQSWLFTAQMVSFVFRSAIDFYNYRSVISGRPAAPAFVQKARDWLPPTLMGFWSFPAVVYIHELGHLLAMHALWKHKGSYIEVYPNGGMTTPGSPGFWDRIITMFNRSHPYTMLGKALGPACSRGVICTAGPAIQFGTTMYVFQRSLPMPPSEKRKILLSASFWSVYGLVAYSYSQDPTHDFQMIQSLSGVPPVVSRIVMVAAPVIIYAQQAPLSHALKAASLFTAANVILHGSI